jgi:hypothetical protein
VIDLLFKGVNGFRIFLRMKRKPESIHIGIGTDVRILEKVPYTADSFPAFQNIIAGPRTKVFKDHAAAMPENPAPTMTTSNEG